MLSFSKNNRYCIAVEKWTIDIASLWKLTIAEVYPNEFWNLVLMISMPNEPPLHFLLHTSPYATAQAQFCQAELASLAGRQAILNPVLLWFFFEISVGYLQQAALANLLAAKGWRSIRRRRDDTMLLRSKNEPRGWKISLASLYNKSSEASPFYWVITHGKFYSWKNIFWGFENSL